MQAATPLDFKSAIATLARHEGVWDGVYRYYDASGVLVDLHRSRLFCRFPTGKPGTYHQTNHYTWDDGRTETRDFPALIRNGRLIWQGDLIRGWAADDQRADRIAMGELHPVFLPVAPDGQFEPFGQRVDH